MYDLYNVCDIYIYIYTHIDIVICAHSVHFAKSEVSNHRRHAGSIGSGLDFRFRDPCYPVVLITTTLCVQARGDIVGI